MTRIVTVANQKGGVGKTTTVVNLAAYCALAGKRTLVVDLDPQGNASSVLARDQFGPSVFSGGTVQPTSRDNLWIIPAGQDILSQEKQLFRDPMGRFALGDRLSAKEADFDLILIDCPPSLAILPINALMAAHMVLIPIQCEYYAMEGLGQILSAISDLKAEGHLGGDQSITILLTMGDAAIPLARQVEQEIRGHFGQQVLQTVIPRDVSLAAAPSHGRTIFEHDPLSPGGLAYLSMAKEFLHGSW